MYIAGVIVVMILATLLMIITWVLFKRRKQKLITLLVIPYFLYFLTLLLFGNKVEVLEVYMNRQIFTLSLGFFSVHVMLTIFILTEMMKTLECQGSEVNDNFE